MNEVMIQFFEWYYPADGTLWKKVSQEAALLKKTGISAVWLPPAYKGSKGVFSQGYDVYDLYDLGEFDQKGTIRTKYGTKEEYISAINTLHQQHIQVYADIVLNQLGGADETEKVMVRKVNPENRTEFISPPFEIEANTKFNFPNRKKKYSAFEWDYNCFTGVDCAKGIEESEKCIYSIINEYGDDWEEVVGNEKGNYDYLMFSDIEFRNTAVREELKRWGKWYFETAGFDGVRLDALKHISPAFYNEWLDFMRINVKHDLFVIGEYWAFTDVPLLEEYIRATGSRIHLFDVPLHYNFHHASNSGKNYDLRGILNNSLMVRRPDLAITFVENHDTQPFQGLESAVEPWFKPLAYALILLRQEGYPCIFYCDLYGTCYTEKRPDGTEEKVLMPKISALEKLLSARKENAWGEQEDYFDHPNCIGWVRKGDGQHEPCAVMLSNGKENQKAMQVGTQYSGSYFIDFLGNSKVKVRIDENGIGNFRVKAGSVSVWVPENQK
ncbi:alpha-amylase [Emticicia sp. BO119]|uniref:alpha-amylase n=1 Tax=Emticicia sp. BO119 TaxID=2757768 RepID=UPI0015F02462|nr:alpha-amylase [Emticicia sp. BO119]MBA4852768.1 alpha-amylase [Emticicia sp. BO119]